MLNKFKVSILLSSLFVLGACDSESANEELSVSSKEENVVVEEVKAEEIVEEDVVEEELSAETLAFINGDVDVSEVNWDEIHLPENYIRNFVGMINMDGADLLVESASISEDGLIEVYTTFGDNSNIGDKYTVIYLKTTLINMYMHSELGTGDLAKDYGMVRFYDNNGDLAFDNEDISSSEESKPNPTSKMGSRSTPIELGNVVGTEFNYEGETATFDIMLDNPIRGAEAWDIIFETNRHNDEAPEGYEYIILDGYFKIYDSSSEDIPFYFSPRIKVVGSDGSPVDQSLSYAYLDNEWGRADVYNGGTLEGKIVALVRKDDENPLISVNPFSGEGIFFKSN